MKGTIQKRYPWDKEYDMNEIQPGHILVGHGPIWHHSIVIKVIRDQKGQVIKFVTMNGNHPGINLGETTPSKLSAYIIPLP